MTGATTSATTSSETLLPPTIKTKDDDRSHSNSKRRYQHYGIYRYGDIEKKWLRPPLSAGMLCWVLQTKGKRRQGGGQRKELLNRALVMDVSSTTTTTTTTNKEDTSGNSPSHKKQKTSNDNINDKDDRILVQYPKGSTYRVKRENILPVLTWPPVAQPLVMVLPETRLYHRWTVVHTQATDQFCEIGCDVGILVHRIWQFAAQRRRIWGLDKGPGGIASAQQRYPDLADQFRVWNVPLLAFSDNDKDNVTTNHGADSTNATATVTEETHHGDDEGDAAAKKDNNSAPQQTPLPMDLFAKDDNNNDDDDDIHKSLVVAIDINGNRELEAVRQCMQLVIQEWKPRLIVVKSRALYKDLGYDETTATPPSKLSPP